MEELRKLLRDMLNEELLQIILSNSTSQETASKIKIRPVLQKDKLMFQQTLFRETQVFHSNHNAEETAKSIERYLKEIFRQVEIKALHRSATVLVSKKGKFTIKIRQNGRNAFHEEIKEGAVEMGRMSELSHNRAKHYILREGYPVEFLVGLGIQTKDGRVVKAKYDKFRQINRYLEFIEDVLEELPGDRTIRIIDFGCGKSYLTFAMYHYLHDMKGYDIYITGLDLKEEVIAHCSSLARQYGYEGLHFEKGDIGSYQGMEQVDMVVSLHACDTATDYALEKAVKWGAKVIFAVPCCQHELNRQISCRELQPILKYGLVKERISALVTDAIRANLLESQGYDTQIIEFIDMEHTPKNLMIRGVKRNKLSSNKRSDLDSVMEFLHIAPTLKRLL